MIRQIEIVRKTRSFLLEQLKNLDTEQLNRMFDGFNNNIIWNLGHMIAAQQGICYKRSGRPTVITGEFMEKFRTGSKPEGIVNDEEIEQIKRLLSTTLDTFETDYNNHIFDNYTTWTTRYAVELKNIDDAIEILPYHDGLHSGIVMAMNRLLTK
jgi:hypothetical protein